MFAEYNSVQTLNQKDSYYRVKPNPADEISNWIYRYMILLYFAPVFCLLRRWSRHKFSLMRVSHHGAGGLMRMLMNQGQSDPRTSANANASASSSRKRRPKVIAGLESPSHP
jgi:hypothetical protein